MRGRGRAAAYSNGARAAAIAGGYAAAVLAISVFVYVAQGLGAVWLILLTVPSSVLVQFIPVQGNLFLLCLTLGGLAQAWLLWLGLRRTRVL